MKQIERTSSIDIIHKDAFNVFFCFKVYYPI